MNNQQTTADEKEKATVATVISNYLVANYVYRELKFRELNLRLTPLSGETETQKHERLAEVAVFAIAAELMSAPEQSSLSELNALHIQVRSRNFTAVTRDLILYDLDLRNFIKGNKEGVDDIGLALRSPQVPSSACWWNLPTMFKRGWSMVMQICNAEYVARDIVQSYFGRYCPEEPGQALPDYQRYKPFLDELLAGVKPTQFDDPVWLERQILKAARRSVAKVTGATHLTIHCRQ